ncbi:MAG: hypothetical protein R3E68_17785 [Burkholderiaceae bacterium]
MPEEQLTRLLRPFELDTARGETEGAGLGLAIVDRMARHSRWQLHARQCAGRRPVGHALSARREVLLAERTAARICLIGPGR